ncbi:hypothetical protein SRB17_55840 [Streptomyces sp. RB17]|nr:hypothetical protein [Streptomyces sp. RB17]
MVKGSEPRCLRRCVEPAAGALQAGAEPFGPVVVAGDGRVLAEDRNRVKDGITPGTPSSSRLPGRPRTPGWASAGSGTSAQLPGSLEELGAPRAPVRPLPAQEVAPGVTVEGPVPEPVPEVRGPHRRFQARRSRGSAEFEPAPWSAAHAWVGRGRIGYVGPALRMAGGVGCPSGAGAAAAGPGGRTRRDGRGAGAGAGARGTGAAPPLPGPTLPRVSRVRAGSLVGRARLGGPRPDRVRRPSSPDRWRSWVPLGRRCGRCRPRRSHPA